MASTRAPRRPQRVDVRGWLGGVRFSAFTGIMLGLVVLGVFVLVPTVSTYVSQQQQISALKESVRVSQQEVEALELQKQRYADPAYLTTQARERLYYVKPGEVVYLVDNDLPAAQQPREAQVVSTEVVETRSNWMISVLRSVVTAGTARTVTVDDSPPNSPQPSGSGSPTATPKK